MRLPIRSIPGAAWPPLPRGDMSQLWGMILELDRTQWLPPEELLQGQLTQVRTLLTHAGNHVPYYAALFRDLDFRPDEVRSLDDFRRLPLLTRSTYQQHYSQFQANALPSGTQLTTTLRTSGTSGMPIEVRQTNLVNLWWIAFHVRDLVWCNVDIRGSLAVIRGLGLRGSEHQRAMDGFKQSHWNEYFPHLFDNGPSYVMDVHQDPRTQLNWLLRVQSDYLLGYPPNLEHLGSLLAERKQRLRNLKRILTIGESLSDETRNAIETAFGVPVMTTYSCVEAGYLASPCPDGHGLHVHAENVLIEVLREDGQPCQPGETGSVVLTTLHNFQNPFVRYQILDSATMAGPCTCGRGLPLLTRVEGKVRPPLLLHDGRRKDSGYLVRHLRTIGGYRQHQIVQQSPAHVIVRLVPTAAWSNAHSEQVIAAVREYLEASIQVDVEIVERIELTQAGKVRDVIVNSHKQD